MSEVVKCPEQFVFGLDIGTRSIVGTVGYMDSNGFHVIAMEVKEHDTRAMLDGQVHDIGKVSEEIRFVKNRLESRIGRPLSQVCIAAAGRVLRTITVHADIDLEEETKITNEHIYALELAGVEMAHRQINEKETDINFYCVGYTPVKFYLNDFEIGNLEGHKGNRISVDLLATFLPEEVVDGLYASVEGAELEVANLTLEPIAAMNVAIPEQYRLLNIALVDVGAGTSDICITRDGSILAYGMIPSAGDEISELIAKEYLVDFTQAEKIKLSAGGKKNIAFKDIMGMKQTVSPAEIMRITDPVTNRIAKEAADKITELNGGKPVSAVFVVGGGGKIPGYTKNLAKELGIMETRVALRGKEVLQDVEFLITNVKKDPLYVTPIGICINYYNQKNNFIFVTVNGERIKLYDNNNLTVLDAIIQAGYPNENLFPRRGPSVQYTLNGQARMVRGLPGEPASIFKNGKEANMNSPIGKNDYIDIEESTIGDTQSIAIGELPEFSSNIVFSVNQIGITCPRVPYVNGNPVTESYQIQNQDVLVMENYYTVSQLFSFMDIPLEGLDIWVNNELANPQTKVYENFSIRYVTEEEESEIQDASIAEPVAQYDELADTGRTITILINGKGVQLKGKEQYRFVDIFDYYPFDLSKIGGETLITNINGQPAEFMGELEDGAIVDLFWK